MINKKWKMINGKCRGPSLISSICHLSFSICHFEEIADIAVTLESLRMVDLGEAPLLHFPVRLRAREFGLYLLLSSVHPIPARHNPKMKRGMPDAGETGDRPATGTARSAKVAELADALDLGSSPARGGSSSLPSRIRR